MRGSQHHLSPAAHRRTLVRQAGRAATRDGGGLLPASTALSRRSKRAQRLLALRQTTRTDQNNQHRQPDRRRQRQNSVHDCFSRTRLQTRGMSVGIVSRGFGRSGEDGAPAALVSDGAAIKLSPEQAGDEPVMMAKSFRGPDRRRAPPHRWHSPRSAKSRIPT